MSFTFDTPFIEFKGRRMHMRHCAFAIAGILALVGCDNKESSHHAGSIPAAGSEAKEPPAARTAAKHPWGGFKKGSFAKMKSLTEMDIAGTKNKTEMTLTYTLKDLTADEAIVETETVMANVPPQKSEMKLPLHGPEAKTSGDTPKPKSSTEELEVAGKKMKCTWTETETDAGGVKTVARVYTNEDVPGFTVKTVTRNPTMTSTMEVVEWSSK
jgi:hypothetical protein